jgi:uncharacterized membrane protein YfcA
VPAQLAATAPWWVWPLALFIACFFLGIIAVPAGVGGGVLFVPIIAGFFPFHLDYVRGAGQLVALSGALVAAPRLLSTGLANLRVGLTMGLIASASSIAGALLSFAVNTSVLETALGIAILAIAAVMAAVPEGRSVSQQPDKLSAALGLHGVFTDAATGEERHWRARRTPQGMAIFVFIGLIAGLFGLGAGWANVPTLNLLMGLPLKVASGTSGIVIATSSSSAAWIYLDQGAVLPIIAAPSILGMMLGARIGARVLQFGHASTIRRLVIGLLLFAGARALAKGMGWWT